MPRWHERAAGAPLAGRTMPHRHHRPHLRPPASRRCAGTPHPRATLARHKEANVDPDALLCPTRLVEAALRRAGLDPVGAEALLREAEAAAMAIDQPSGHAQVAAARAEIAFLAGDWDGALRWTRTALGLAIPGGFDAITLWTWTVVAPVAAHRQDDRALRQLGAWLAPREASGMGSRGTLLRAALDHLVAAGTGADPRTPDPDHLRDAWPSPDTDAAFVAARDAVLRAWWDDGRFDDLADALAMMPDEAGSPLGTGARLLWLARMGADEASIVGTAREALARLRRSDAAWWIEQAIGILDDAGDATRDEREERRLIRPRLLGDP
jgi:hypothetical protein